MTPSIDISAGSSSSPDAAALFVRHFPVENEVARLLLVHGLGEHSGRYVHIVDRLNRKGISVTAYDHRGHGKSAGKRGHLQAFDEYIRDLDAMVAECRKGMPGGIRFFMLGHSMGGLLVLNFAQRFADKMDGVIASSPGLAPANPIPKVKGTAGRLMSKLWPSLTFDNELVPEHLSHDRSVVDAYVNDPLVHRRISARWFTEVMAAMDETRRNAERIKTPVLMQVAGDDRIVDPSVSRDFFKRIGIEDKRLCYYDDLFHEIYNEVDEDRNRVLEDLESWLDRRV